MEKDGYKVDELIIQIIAYLTEHPKAADSLEGVVQWWLGMSHDECVKEDVKSALSVMEQRGIIKKRILADGKDIYWMSETRN